jgi:hypothetical protein
MNTLTLILQDQQKQILGTRDVQSLVLPLQEYADFQLDTALPLQEEAGPWDADHLIDQLVAIQKKLQGETQQSPQVTGIITRLLAEMTSEERNQLSSYTSSTNELGQQIISYEQTSTPLQQENTHAPILASLDELLAFLRSGRNQNALLAVAREQPAA